MRFLKIILIIFFSWCGIVSAQEVPKALKNKITLYRAERSTIRNELIAKFQENSGASREEKSQLIMGWRTQNSERIQEHKRLGNEIIVNLREEVLNKYQKLNHLSPEESEKVIQQWYSDNDISLSGTGESQPLEMAKQEFRQEARERATALRTEYKNFQKAKKEHVSRSRASSDINREGGSSGGGNSGGNSGDNGKGNSGGKDK